MSTQEHATAVLLLAFGGPESVDEIEPFLRELMEGRQVTPGQIESVKQRYRLIGGGSPLKSITAQQAKSLEAALNESGPAYRVFVGMRYTPPFIEQSVDRILSLGIRDLVALPLSPYYNSASTGKYLQKLEQAVSGKQLHTKVIRSYNTNSIFMNALEQSVREIIKDVDNPYVIFSAHSLPAATARADGYGDQLEQTLNLMVQHLSLSRFALGFQSKGMAGGDWLGPDVKEILERCANNGEKNIVVVPYGFVSDHVETLYDIDIVYKDYAVSLGLNFFRAPSLNASPLFIQALKDVVAGT